MENVSETMLTEEVIDVIPSSTSIVLTEETTDVVLSSTEVELHTVSLGDDTQDGCKRDQVEVVVGCSGRGKRIKFKSMKLER